MLPTRSLPGLCLSLMALSLIGCGGGSTNEDSTLPPAKGPLGWLVRAIKPAPPNTIATIEALANKFQTQGRTALAEQHYRQALTLREYAWGPEDLHVVPGLEHLADFSIAQGRYTEAESFLQRALAIREQRLGAEHPDVATSLEKYATLLRQMQRDAEAQALEARAQAIRAQPAQTRPVSRR